MLVTSGHHLAADGAIVFAKACELGLEGICVETGGQLLSEREKPQLAEDEEPEFRQDVIAMPRDSAAAGDRILLSAGGHFIRLSPNRPCVTPAHRAKPSSNAFAFAILGISDEPIALGPIMIVAASTAASHTT
jgi:hypothetical protein